MLWNIADFLERKGYFAGLLIVFAPIAYDVIGILYGRDLHIKVETWGVIIQIVGLLVIGLARYVRKWGR